MELKPSGPPGHARRKLRGLVDEISRLRAEGYTIRAIHQAVIDAGISVGWATVQREVSRLGKLNSPSATTPRQPPPATPTGSDHAAAAPMTPAEDVASYFDRYNSNPLLRRKTRT